MTYRSQSDVYARAIEDAREKVAKAQQAYARGGSLTALNKANRELADRHAEYQECQGGNVPDTR
jgi:hypothetical protein